MPTAQCEVWTPLEREAWRPPERVTVSQWAERYRILPRGQSPRPGPWRNATAPYLRGLMDLPLKPGVVEVNVCKAAQIGVSEALRNLLGYCAHLDPEPCGLALPSRDKGRKIVMNRLIPMLQETAPLRDLLTTRSADIQSEQIRLLNGWILHLMWSGSATAMASDPMRIAVCDEVDKFEAWTGRDADPVSLVSKRLRAYEERAVQINVSTPTTRLGKICQLLEASTVRLLFHVPCPHCGTFQPLQFPRLKWAPPADRETPAEHAARIVRDNAVWYECAGCAERILPDQREAMIRAGEWRSEGGSPIADADGVEHPHAEDVDRFPPGTRIGVQINALYCLWESWADIAAEFLVAKGSLTQMFDFRTETLGEPFEQITTGTHANLYEAKCARAALPEGVAPRWAVRLVATVDTQHDHFWIVIRAWGPGMRSQRIYHGRAESFEELDDLCFRRRWATENPDRVLPVDLVLIDSGGTRLEDERASRTMQVYRWALLRGRRVRPIKGAPRPREGLFIWSGRGFVDRGPHRRTKRRSGDLRLWFIDVNHFADELANLVVRGTERGSAASDIGPIRPIGPMPDEEPWLLNQRNDPTYNEHLSNAMKVVSRRGSLIEEIWVPKGAGARIDLFDCEVYQVAGAYMLNVHVLPQVPPPGPPDSDGAAPAQAPPAPRPTSPRPRGKRDAWKPTRYRI